MEFKLIGRVSSPYQAAFGTPRQSGLVRSVKSRLLIDRDFSAKKAWRGLESFSHIWVIYVFDQNLKSSWQEEVMPPRPEEASRMAVFATRSPLRPNPIGISVAELKSMKWNEDKALEITVSSLDAFDGSPIIDIKPYLPYADALPEASFGWTQKPPERWPVLISASAAEVIDKNKADHPELESILRECLSLDPRPTSWRRKYPRGQQGKIFRFPLLGFRVQFSVSSEVVELVSLERITA